MTDKPSIAIIPGGLAGIGPELTAKLLNEPGILDAADITLVGHQHLWQRGARAASKLRALLHILERKAGRVLVKGFPTVFVVSDAMIHGGPYPASTNYGATSVGTLSIRRFLRPGCFQNMLERLVPEFS